MKKSSRIRKHRTIRKKVLGTGNRPRLCVFKSGKHIYAQIIDDKAGKTLVFQSDFKLKGTEQTKKEKAYAVGKKISEKAIKAKIKEVVFDRGGFLYHGRIAEVARGAREGGLKF